MRKYKKCKITFYVNNVCVITVWLTPPEVAENAMERHATTHATKMPWRKALVAKVISRVTEVSSWVTEGILALLKKFLKKS